MRPGEGGSIGEGLREMGQEREISFRTCSDGEQPTSWCFPNAAMAIEAVQ